MRYNLFNCVQINANAAPGFSSGQAIAAVDDISRRACRRRWVLTTCGMSYQEVKAAQGVSPAMIFGLAFFVVFLIMAAQYESWTLPFAYCSASLSPFSVRFHACTSACSITMFMRKSVSIMLIGLSAKNAILIVEFAKMEYDNGKPLVEAALTGAICDSDRF